MTVTAIEGVVENGRIRLSEEVTLPENTRVFVIVANDVATPAVAHLRSPRLADPQQTADFRKQVLECSSNAKL